MKFKVGDSVKITIGKDKGKTGKIVKVLPKSDKVVVQGLNLYVKHRKPYGDQKGQKLSLERPLSTAKIAILNDKGQIDRIKMQLGSDGSKIRIYAKTKKIIPTSKEKKQ